MNAKIGDPAQVCSLRRYTLTEGRGRGLDVIDCDNGRLRFLLNVTKALDVMQLYFQGTNVSFVSKNGFSPSEAAFEARFEGGMLYTCGLDSVGAREGHALHGSFHNTPAAVTLCRCDQDGIAVEAETASTAFNGKELVVRRRVFSAIGSDTLAVSDTLVNRGSSEQPYCLLYHVNLGYPFLDEGVRVEADETGCIPRTPAAAAETAARYTVETPFPGREETCYFLSLRRPEIAVVDPGSRLRFRLGWSQETLPHFMLWKSMAAGAYALGLEPSTAELDGRFSYRTVRPGESVSFSLTMRLERT